MAEKKDLRRLTAEDLTEELRAAREELLDLRMQLATRQLKDVRAIPRVRRRIARAMTIAREREIEKSA
ncbi:MAG: 50S ribosomal protein L29 [Chloroflexi bacterium RIFCSPLOWO2_12_FULL_71_12]|nr:MAG: 50S ribosomal protein L29 [Chloroflexi bacterium GWC2_70_10]OGO71917.1 MAG: 50S ribosomal protein L29 [Chloroflexi bacterium RIFCSPLOWO2_02_FULL_71_16]OGO72494.1 MAG: 50S ribosomal protein L29 [Chloroflexi bacterium RIFCSPLOWO2_12_FULL_71_12]